MPEPWKESDLETVHALQAKEKAERKRRDGVRVRKLKELGFEGVSSGDGDVLI